MLGFTYTAFLPDPVSPSPPQADNRMKIRAMKMLRGCIVYFNSAANPTVKLMVCIGCDKVSRFLEPLLESVSLPTNKG